jgi:hypothetical protein
MADIRVTSTGKILYKIDDSTAALLIEALPSVFERANAPAPAAPAITRRWFVNKTIGEYQDSFGLICSDSAGNRMCFTGKPDAYLKNPPVWCGSTCPKEVLEQYKREKEKPQPFVGLTDAQAAAANNNRHAEQLATEKLIDSLLG